MTQPSTNAWPRWRLTGIGILRISFGLAWAVDAWFKWQPDFIHGLTSYLTGAQEGQPGWVKDWIGFWIDIVKVNPRAFAYVVAVGETAVAIGLLLGAFSNATYLVGSMFAVVIWTTAEGFGGPYTPGSTDIGGAIIYVIVFGGLILSSAGLYLGIDRKLTPKLGRRSFLGSPMGPD